MAIDYDGDDIKIDEMPQGCIIYPKGDSRNYILIASFSDALAVIQSLSKMLIIQFGKRQTNDKE